MTESNWTTTWLVLEFPRHSVKGIIPIRIEGDFGNKSFVDIPSSDNYKVEIFKNANIQFGQIFVYANYYDA